MRPLTHLVHSQRLRRTLGAASCVHERARFVGRELRAAPSLGSYRLLDSGLVAHVRHPLLDMWVLEEIFRFRAYELPASAARALGKLGRPIRIADLGGHVGLFGLFMLGRFPEASIVSFEPDPRNVAVLRQSVEVNDLQGQWSVIEGCAGASDGTTEFDSSFHLSRTASVDDHALEMLQEGIARQFPFLQRTGLLSTTRHRVALRDAFPSLADADLIKIDIEGGEWAILDDHRFAELRAKAVVLEYHPAYLGVPDAEAAVIRALRWAGYHVGEPMRGVDAGVIWAWRDSGSPWPSAEPPPSRA